MTAARVFVQPRNSPWQKGFVAGGDSFPDTLCCLGGLVGLVSGSRSDDKDESAIHAGR